MLKKLVKGAVIGGALLAMSAGAANAAEYNINIYGASAQYTFWSEGAAAFLDDDCNTTVQWAKDSADKQGIAYCSDYGTNSDSVYIRYASKASYDGIYAVSGQDPLGNSGSCGDGEREMADEGQTTFGSYVEGGTAPEGVAGYACKDITVGASDVNIATFDQESHGLKYGPKTTSNDWFDSVMKNLTWGEEGYTPRVLRPIVVPFSFFRNANATTAPNQDNLILSEAAAIFSGQVTDWMQIDETLSSSIPMIVCMRHAGSGTVATLNAAVMSNTTFTLVTEQALPTDFPVIMGWTPVTYFNEGSSDMMRCVGGAGTKSGYDTYDGIGAIGYADTDKVIMTPALTGEYHDTDSYGDVKLMKYQGAYGTKENIVNGNYEFWSAQWLFTDQAEGAPIDDLIDALEAYASNPDNMPAGNADYWAAQDEMNFEKLNDFTTQHPK